MVVDVLAVAIVISGFVLLLVSAARHLRWRETFTVQLNAQAIWPRGSEPAVAWAIIALEGLVGAGGVLALASGSSASAMAPFLWALVAVGLAFVGIQLFLRFRRPGAPCGCNPTSEATVGWGSLCKAAWPAAAGMTGLLWLPAAGLDALSSAAAVGASLFGLVLVWALDTLPVGRAGRQPAS